MRKQGTMQQVMCTAESDLSLCARASEQEHDAGHATALGIPDVLPMMCALL